MKETLDTKIEYNKDDIPFIDEETLIERTNYFFNGEITTITNSQYDMSNFYYNLSNKMYYPRNN